MKKLIILLITLSMLLACITSCSESDPSDGTVSNAVYDLLNELSDKDYSNIKIDIAITTNFVTLYSSYVLTQNLVVYSIDKLNTLQSDLKPTDLPSSYKTTLTGHAMIQNGQVIELDGNSDTSLPSYDELKGSFNFDKDNFTNATADTNCFEADVLSPSKFYGTYVDTSNLKVKVEYTETSLTKITLSYNTGNAEVQTVYTFGN